MLEEWSTKWYYTKDSLEVRKNALTELASVTNHKGHTIRIIITGANIKIKCKDNICFEFNVNIDIRKASKGWLTPYNGECTILKTADYMKIIDLICMGLHIQERSLQDEAEVELCKKKGKIAEIHVSKTSVPLSAILLIKNDTAYYERFGYVPIDKESAVKCKNFLNEPYDLHTIKKDIEQLKKREDMKELRISRSELEKYHMDDWEEEQKDLEFEAKDVLNFMKLHIDDKYTLRQVLERCLEEYNKHECGYIPYSVEKWLRFKLKKLFRPHFYIKTYVYNERSPLRQPQPRPQSRQRSQSKERRSPSLKPQPRPRSRQRSQSKKRRSRSRSQSRRRR